ncbi:MAG: AAA family ATPase [Firmicutes bacterium]|nr:AAA family ATPase [Bacillota bacterium]
MNTIENRLLEKIIYVENYLNNYFLERADLISLLLLTIFSRQNMFIMGKPGIAKSEVVNCVSLVIGNARIFRYLLTKYTTPEEIFGPVSFNELKKDRFCRKIENRLADVEIGFLDEIFKGNSSILNCLLMIANERIYINDTDIIKVPLISLFGASNEIPDEEEMEELQALYDRFVIKYIAGPIKDFRNFSKLLLSDDALSPADKNKLLDLDDLLSIYNESQKITPDQTIINLLYKVREYCYENNYYVSDRKFKNIIKILKVCAYVNGRSTIIIEDLFILPYMIWEKPEDFPAIQSDINNILFEHIFDHILSSISIKISESFTNVIDELINSANTNYTEFVKCYSYLKQRQKEDLIIQHKQIREYLYKVTKIVEQLDAQITNYNPKSHLKILQSIHHTIINTINNKSAKFIDYQNRLSDLNERIQRALAGDDGC